MAIPEKHPTLRGVAPPPASGPRPTVKSYVRFQPYEEPVAWDPDELTAIRKRCTRRVPFGSTYSRVYEADEQPVERVFARR